MFTSAFTPRAETSIVYDSRAVLYRGILATNVRPERSATTCSVDRRAGARLAHCLQMQTPRNVVPALLDVRYVRAITLPSRLVYGGRREREKRKEEEHTEEIPIDGTLAHKYPYS